MEERNLRHFFAALVSTVCPATAMMSGMDHKGIHDDRNSCKSPLLQPPFPSQSQSFCIPKLVFLHGYCRIDHITIRNGFYGVRSYHIVCIFYEVWGIFPRGVKAV